MREAAEAFGAVEEVCQEAGENGAGMHWRVCFADTRDAEVCSRAGWAIGIEHRCPQRIRFIVGHRKHPLRNTQGLIALPEVARVALPGSGVHIP